MQKKRILCVVREVLPYPGGYSIRGENIFGELSKYFDTHVAVSNYDKSNFYNIDRFERNGVKFYINQLAIFLKKKRIANIPGSSLIIRYLNRHFFYSTLKKIADIIKPDIIIAHTPTDVALPAMWLSKKIKKPLIFDVRQFNFVNVQSIRVKYEKMLIRKVIKHSNGFAAISKGIEKIIKSFLNKNDTRTIAHIPNGISEDFIKRSERSSESEKKLISSKEKFRIKGFVFGYIGTITGYEGLDLLIDVYANINLKNSTLLIVGDGPYFHKIEKKVVGLGKENIIIAGRVPHEDIFSFYKLIDVFVLPRISIPLTESVTPIKPFEIMYSKKPIICSNVGGFMEIIENGKNGIVFEANNKNDLEKCLRDTFNDKDLRNNIVNQAFRDIQNKYLWEVIGKNYMELIYNVIQK